MIFGHQVYTGPHRPASSRIYNVTSARSLQIGHLVAVYCENYANPPAIGKCTNLDESSVQIEWMKGTYSSSWKTWMIQDVRNRRKKVPWTDWVPKESIILFDFDLTLTNRLRKTTIEHLKSKYAELNS